MSQGQSNVQSPRFSPSGSRDLTPNQAGTALNATSNSTSTLQPAAPTSSSKSTQSSTLRSRNSPLMRASLADKSFLESPTDPTLNLMSSSQLREDFPPPSESGPSVARSPLFRYSGFLKSMTRSKLSSRLSNDSESDDDSMFDPDDPRMTGIVDKDGHPNGAGAPSLDDCSRSEKEQFIFALTKALMAFGAPAHRIESQIEAIAVLLQIDIHTIHIPNITIISFGGDVWSPQVRLKIIKSQTKVDLGRLRIVHQVYRGVVHQELNPRSGTTQLRAILAAEPIYDVRSRIIFAGISGAILTPMAYKGSCLDLAAAGIVCAIIGWMHFWAAKKSTMFANVVDISSAMFAAFCARGLSSIPTGIFCYSAIVSAAIVKLLPKYLVICGALELASKQIISGSVKLVYAIIWSLFIGFSVTFGSDVYFLVDSSARERRNNATAHLEYSLQDMGEYILDGADAAGAYMFDNYTKLEPMPTFTPGGCYRQPGWPWYLRSPPFWTLFILVPLYAIFTAFAASQPWKRNWELPVMVLISCCSYGANRTIKWAFPVRGDVSSAVGAFVIGSMGHIYSRAFKGTAFQVMFNGIGFLVPSAISTTGGLAQNYRGRTEDQYTSSLTLGFRMITVAMGTTVGLYTSSLIVYSFGKKKRGALFAF